MANFRMKAYIVNGTHRAGLLTGPMEESDCEALLDNLVEAGFVIGGHIEEHIESIGWVVVDYSS